MRNEITLLLRGLGDKIDPQISAFLLHGLETGAFDYSIYTEVYDVKIVVNQGNEDTLRRLLDKFKLITRTDVHRVIERCLSLDIEPVKELEEEEEPEGSLSFIKRTTQFLNRPPKVDPIHLGPFANKRLLDYGPTIDRITDGIASNCQGFSRLEAFIVSWMITDTFLHTAENKTRLDNFKSAGRVERKCWITQRDEKVRRSHQLVERQEVNLYEPFLVANEKLEFPGDPEASFENILLCRCYMVPVA
ncbi:MAG: hypothetical protein AAF564_15365 [Bacteroidota bacterium]